MTTRRGFFGMILGLAASPWLPKDRGVSYRVTYAYTPRPDFMVRRREPGYSYYTMPAAFTPEVYRVFLKKDFSPSQLGVDRVGGPL